MLLASSLLNTNTVPIVSLLQLQRWATSQNRLVPRGGVSFVRQRVAPFSVLLVIGITILLVYYYVLVCLPFLSLREIRLRLQDLTEMDCVSAGGKLRDDIFVAKSYNIVGWIYLSSIIIHLIIYMQSLSHLKVLLA
jgi:hypothetical protein